jgi:hypothetical protein
MNVMTEVHPFLDGKTKRMLIDGRWLEAASGKTFAMHNPATGELLAMSLKATPRISMARSPRRVLRSMVRGANSNPPNANACCCVSRNWWNAT